MPAQNVAGEPDKNKKFHERFPLTSKARFGGLFFVPVVARGPQPGAIIAVNDDEGDGCCRHRLSAKGKNMIRYMGTKRKTEGTTVYVFVINGLEKEVREGDLKRHPGCYEALPASAKARIAANRSWLSQL